MASQPVIPCPDPSAHKNIAKSGDHASTAALYATKSERDLHGNTHGILNQDNKLSSASAATSLKHARPQDLPAFPIVGVDKQHSAGAAANIANANPKSVEWWKPEGSSNAEKAAFLARDYKAQPLWRPEASAAGSKAALQAHRDGGKVDIWTPEKSQAGNSAAGIAMRKREHGAQSGQRNVNDGKNKALSAANGAVSQRKRSGSTPLPGPRYPDSNNSGRNALSAAASAHKPSNRGPIDRGADRMGSEAMEAARIKHIGTKLPREMYSEHPPIASEVEEKKHQDALRASALSMAKKMYDVQQKHIDEAAGVTRSDGQMAASRVHRTEPAATPETDLKQQAMQYLNVQEAAQKLAAERLAKIQGDDTTAYRNYYGYSSQHKSRLSIRKGRRRASSEGEMYDSDDDNRSRRIRSQMSQLQDRLAGVDEKKRQKDKEALMAAAERRVQARMHEMDEKVYNETGKVSNSMMEEWEAKARQRAKAESDARMKHHGKVDIGGGKFLDQEEIDAVAAARIKPTLDEINEKAERQRAKDEEARLDAEERKRQAQLDKKREIETEAELKRVKEEEKTAARIRKSEEKQAAKTQKELEKAAKAEEKRLHKEQKRKSKELPSPIAAQHHDTVTKSIEYNSTEEMPRDKSPDHPSTSGATGRSPAEALNDAVHKPAGAEKARDTTSHDSPSSPTSPKGIKGLVNKLKRRSRGPESPTSPTKTFTHSGTSEREPAEAPEEPADRPVGSTKKDRDEVSDDDLSSVSSLYSENDQVKGNKWKSKMKTKEEVEEEKDGFDESLAPPPKFSYEGLVSGSHGRETRFHEQM